MEMTVLLAKIVGPVLVLRGVSILIDREHFVSLLEGLDKEVNTISFSMFPIAMLMAAIALAVTHRDTSSLAAILFHLIAWGAIVKTSLLILFPKLLVAKAQMLGRAGFLNVVLVMCLAVGGYLTWFGYLAVTTA